MDLGRSDVDAVVVNSADQICQQASLIVCTYLKGSVFTGVVTVDQNLSGFDVGARDCKRSWGTIGMQDVSTYVG